MVQTLVENYKPDFANTLLELGQLHYKIGIKVEDFVKVQKSFMKALYKIVKSFDPRDEKAWKKVFAVVFAAMALAYPEKGSLKEIFMLFSILMTCTPHIASS